MYRTRSDDPYADMALGLISTQSFPAIVGIADMMLKSSAVTLVGYEQIGSGYCTAVVRGGTPDVRMAIQTGEELGEQFGQKTSSIIIPRPMPNLEEVLPIGSRLAQLLAGRENNRFRDQAVGLIETRGFPALAGAADAMLKSADVTLSAYHTTGAGLCTAIVRGTMSNVAAAIEVGMAEADRIGELHAVMVIPRPLEDLERALPIADCWIEELQPVRMPINITVEEMQRERTPLQPLEIPEVQPLPAAMVEQQPFEPIKMETPQPLEPLTIEQRIDPIEQPPFEPLKREATEALEPIAIEAPIEVLETPVTVEPIEPAIDNSLPQASPIEITAVVAESFSEPSSEALSDTQAEPRPKALPEALPATSPEALPESQPEPLTEPMSEPLEE